MTNKNQLEIISNCRFNQIFVERQFMKSFYFKHIHGSFVSIFVVIWGQIIQWFNLLFSYWFIIEYQIIQWFNLSFSYWFIIEDQIIQWFNLSFSYWSVREGQIIQWFNLLSSYWFIIEVTRWLMNLLGSFCNISQWWYWCCYLGRSEGFYLVFYSYPIYNMYSAD